MMVASEMLVKILMQTTNITLSLFCDDWVNAAVSTFEVKTKCERYAKNYQYSDKKTSLVILGIKT